MTARLLRPAITASTVIAVLVAALAVYAFVTTGTTHADSTYNPAGVSTTTVAPCSGAVPALGASPSTCAVKYCNAMGAFPDADIVGVPTCTENLATGAAADNTNFLSYPSGDLNFASVVTLAPGTETITAGAPGSVGTKIGGLHSDTTLGLLNGACASLVPVNFVFYNIALPSSLTSPRSTGGSPESLPAFTDLNGTGLSTNIAFPLPQGTTDRFSRWHVGAEATDPADPLVTYTGGRADPTNIPIINYPSYLLDVFDPDWVSGVSDGPTDPIVPNAVYGALSTVTGTSIPLYFAQFDASGARAVGTSATTPMPAPLGLLTSAMGQPSVSVLNDPSAYVASASSITDFCTPLAITTTLLGTSVTGGNVRKTNAGSAGTVFTQQYNASLRDLDQDGIENTLDTCPIVADASHDPRDLLNPNDTDGDGIGNACDGIAPYPVATANPGNSSQDGDAFQNRQDVCPQNSDPLQTESEIAVVQADKGVRTDGMGNACDTFAVPSFNQDGNPVAAITLSTTVGNGRYMITTLVTPKCIGAIDADADGYCQAQDGGSGAASTDGPPATVGGCATTTPASCLVRHAAWGSGLKTACLDTDSDGFCDGLETYLGTDPVQPCNATPVPPATAGGVNDESPNDVDAGAANTGGDNWPFDFNDDRLAGLPDVTSFPSRFGPINKTGSTAYDGKRWDLNADGLVGLPDVTLYSSVFSKRCGQGTVGMPGPFLQQ